MSNNLTDVDNNRDSIVNIKNNVNNVNSKNNNAYSNLDRVKNLYIKKTRVKLYIQPHMMSSFYIAIQPYLYKNKILPSYKTQEHADTNDTNDTNDKYSKINMFNDTRIINCFNYIDGDDYYDGGDNVIIMANRILSILIKKNEFRTKKTKKVPYFQKLCEINLFNIVSFIALCEESMV